MHTWAHFIFTFRRNRKFRLQGWLISVQLCTWYNTIVWRILRNIFWFGSNSFFVITCPLPLINLFKNENGRVSPLFRGTTLVAVGFFGFGPCGGDRSWLCGYQPLLHHDQLSPNFDREGPTTIAPPLPPPPPSCSYHHVTPDAT